MTTLPNKFSGKYDWNINSKTGVGVVWVVAAFVLPMLVWAISTLARMSGWVAPTKANPAWALVWLLFSPPCLLIAARCFAWKSWRLIVSTALCLAACVILSMPAALLIVSTLNDLLKQAV